jgi:hypothetical protein
MMGEIISRMTVVEVVNIIISTNWRGELSVSYGRVTRVLTTDQGALKHAQTDYEGERLGQQLIGAGLLTVHLPLQAMLMEGVQRLDEMQLVRLCNDIVAGNRARTGAFVAPAHRPGLAPAAPARTWSGEPTGI